MAEENFGNHKVLGINSPRKCFSQFEKSRAKTFPCGLMFSHSRLLFIKDRNVVNQDLTNYVKSLAHSCKTNSFLTFNKLQQKRKGTDGLKRMFKKFYLRVPSLYN